jgi:hypothetical protein
MADLQFAFARAIGLHHRQAAPRVPHARRSPRLPQRPSPTATLSDAVNWRGVLACTDSCEAPFMLDSRGLRSGSPSSGVTFRPRTCGGLGKSRRPHSAHRYKDSGDDCLKRHWHIGVDRTLTYIRDRSPLSHFPGGVTRRRLSSGYSATKPSRFGIRTRGRVLSVRVISAEITPFSAGTYAVNT